MNDDLISRSALKKVIEDSVSQYGGQYSADMLNMWALFSHIINDAPTVEPTFGLFKEMLCTECDKRPQCEWLTTGEEQGALGIIYKIRKCSKCGWEHSLVIPDKYCPNCGAEKRKEEEGRRKKNETN